MGENDARMGMWVRVEGGAVERVWRAGIKGVGIRGVVDGKVW